MCCPDSTQPTVPATQSPAPPPPPPPTPAPTAAPTTAAPTTLAPVVTTVPTVPTTTKPVPKKGISSLVSTFCTLLHSLAMCSIHSTSLKQKTRTGG